MRSLGLLAIILILIQLELHAEKVNPLIPAPVDTITDYTSLRAYTGPATIVFVKNFTKIMPRDSQIWTTIGGIFISHPSGKENGGTVITALNGTRWYRQFDQQNFYPEWWEAGGYDEKGYFYTNMATRGGIKSSGDALEAVYKIAGRGKTVIAKGIYKIYGPIQFSYNTTTLASDGRFFAEGRRIKSTLKQNARNGQPYILVNEANLFTPGDNIYVCNNNGRTGQTWQGRGYGEGSGITPLVISRISGDTLFFPNNLTAYYSIPSADTSVVKEVVDANGFNHADTVTLCFSMFESTLDSSDLQPDQSSFIGGYFYGYGNEVAFYDWRMNHAIARGNSKVFHSISIDQCIFRNSPTEAVMMYSGQVSNCRFDSCWSSATHWNNTDEKNHTYINNCKGEYFQLAGAKVGHWRQGVHSFSSNVVRFIETDGKYANGKWCLGDVGVDDRNFRFENTKYENFSEGIVYIIVGAGVSKARHNIVKCQFIDCGDIEITNAKLEKGHALYNFYFTDNVIVNGRFIGSGLSGGEIRGNKFQFDYTSPFRGGIKKRAALSFDNATDLVVQNNEIIANKYSDTLAVGIFFSDFSSTVVRDSTFMMQRHFIRDNTIYGFAGGITFDDDLSDVITGSALINTLKEWVFEGNTIIMTDSAIVDRYGIYTIPGVLVRNNRIYMDNPSPDTRGIIACGLKTLNAAKIAEGPRLIDNIIYGQADTGIGIYAGGLGGANYNITANGNIIVGCTTAIFYGSNDVFKYGRFMFNEHIDAGGYGADFKPKANGFYRKF